VLDAARPPSSPPRIQPRTSSATVVSAAVAVRCRRSSSSRGRRRLSWARAIARRAGRRV
jgi:hypothetical protein